MQDYEPLTYRYRPRSLLDVIGQERAVRQITGMFKSQKFFRTILISGPYGSGKTTLARIIGRMLNCSSLQDNLIPCFACPPCKSMEKVDSSRDYKELDMATNRGIDEVRALIEKSRLAPFGKYRVFVLDEVHAATSQAFQAMLKVLEEPPSRTVFILVTTSPEKLPDTVASRCLKIPLQKVKLDDTLHLLTRICASENVSIPNDLLKRITISVNNHPRDAISSLESVLLSLSGGAKDVSIENAVEETLALTPDTVVTKFLEALFFHKPNLAFKCAKAILNKDLFLQRLTSFLQQLLYMNFSPSLFDSYYEDNLSKFHEVVLEDIVFLFEEVVSLRGRILDDGSLELLAAKTLLRFDRETKNNTDNLDISDLSC